MESAHLRIGELSRRVGVPPELLRAWEQRYGLLQPVRSAGGFRLYTTADANRVRSMRHYLDAGISAAQAARLALAEQASEAGDARGSAALAPLASDLGEALDRLDEPGAHAALDRLLASFTLQTVLRDVLLPYLHELGERWERGDASVAQEHFASNVLRGRLLGLARGWGQSAGPRAVLACAPGELHDLALIMFGLTLAGAAGRSPTLAPYTDRDHPGVAPGRSSRASSSSRRRRPAAPRRAGTADRTRPARTDRACRRRGGPIVLLALSPPRCCRGIPSRRRSAWPTNPDEFAGRQSWSSTQTRSRRAPSSLSSGRRFRPFVERSAAGAKLLGEARMARGAARDIRRDPFTPKRRRTTVRLFGIGPALLRFGQTDFGQLDHPALSLPDLRRPARPHSGRFDLVHANRV